MTAPLKGSRASCSLDRGETETRCVEARCSDCDRRRPSTLAEYDTLQEEPFELTCWTGWGTRDGHCGRLTIERLRAELASTIPASAVRALVEELERSVRETKSALSWGEHNDRARLDAQVDLLEKVRALLPKPEEKVRRAPVQGSRRIPRGQPGHLPGTISWAEHVEAWEDYAKRCGRDQSAERIAERGGFGHSELVNHLGHLPTTWEPIR